MTKSASARISGLSEAPESEPERLHFVARIEWLMLARLFVATLLLASLLLTGSSDFGDFTPNVVLWAAGVTYGVSLAFAVWLPRTKNLMLVAALQTAWDLILITTLVYVTGGAASVLTFMYGVSVLMSALVVGPRAAIATGAMAFGMYTAVGIGLSNAWIQFPPDQRPEQYLLTNADLAFSLLSNAVGLLLVVLLAANLALRLHEQGSELRRVARNIASLERLNDDIIRSIRGGLLTSDLEGCVHTVNPAGAHIFGATPEDLFGRQIRELVPIPDANEDSGDSDIPRRYAGEGARADGTRFPIGFTVAPLVGGDGEVLGTLISFQDLTEIEELRLAAERAEKLAAVGKLAASLAHEIRNPLSSISGSVQLVMSAETLEEDDQNLLGIVLDEVDRLEDLVASILHMGSPKPPVRVATDLCTMARGVVDVARRGPAGSLGIAIECQTPDEVVVARVDPDQVRQVLWNLIKNAIQASPQFGSVCVSIYASSNEEVVMEVGDEGDGIRPVDRKRVFESYHSSRTHGVGLGLALVRQIVDGHRGRIEVDSPPGRGATFRVSFPRIHSEPPAKAVNT